MNGSRFRARRACVRKPDCGALEGMAAEPQGMSKRCTGPVNRRWQVRPCASLLLSIACLPAAVAAQASPGDGQLAATSSGSIRISVSVRPRVRVSPLTVSGALTDSPAGSLQSSGGICLVRGNTPGNFTVMLQSPGASSDAVTVELHPDRAATATCRSPVSNATETAAGYRLPTAGRAGPPYNLLIIPE